jgi:hypothetical protein
MTSFKFAFDRFDNHTLHSNACPSHTSYTYHSDICLTQITAEI